MNHNPHIHPNKTKLLDIFNVKATWANLRQRKNVKNLIEDQEFIIAKFETMFNNTKTKNDDDFIRYEIVKHTKELETLSHKHEFLKRHYKDLKNNTSSTVDTSNFVEYDKEAIRRVPISQILKEHGHHPVLVSQGREFYRCIFHNEKTPSMVVNLDENYAHCFGCATSADVIKVYQHLTGLDFIKTLRELSNYI